MKTTQGNFSDPKEVLKKIAERTARYKTPGIGILFMEIICYFLFLTFVALAIYLPGYLELKLDAVEEEIGFYTLDPEDRIVWSRMLRIFLLVSGFFPLLLGIFFRLLSRMRRVLSEVGKLSRLVF